MRQKHVAICSKRNNFEEPEIRNNAQQLTQMEQPETLRKSASSTVAPATTHVTQLPQIM